MLLSPNQFHLVVWKNCNQMTIRLIERFICVFIRKDNLIRFDDRSINRLQVRWRWFAVRRETEFQEYVWIMKAEKNVRMTHSQVGKHVISLYLSSPQKVVYLGPAKGFLMIKMTESPRRNILEMNQSLLTGLDFFWPLPVLGISVHISLTFSKTKLKCLKIEKKL